MSWGIKLCCVAMLALPGTKAFAKAPAERRVVLPVDVTPDHYRIEVTPDEKALTFAGTVQIDVTVHKATGKIVLNAADIVVDSAAISGETKAPAVRYDAKEQTVTFAPGHVLKPGPYTLSLAYRGKIYEQASGLFALDYDGGKKRALFTQFENSDARRFVPCWDEPGRKATFALAATVAADELPISNMPIASTEAAGAGLKKVRFAETPKMSSYLLFFGVGDFERVHRDVNGVDVGVVVKRGDTSQAGYALDAAAALLPYYNDYFGKAYPLPKMDLIAGPGTSQFFSAMENWGAIFYFERALLFDPRVSTERDKQLIFAVIAHEMAHQWFGDLVTMAWWDDLWLNEGFASWMGNKATDHFHPEWHVWLSSLNATQGAMQTDARDGTHPIITPILDVLQASGAFDNITYSKGAAVIRTLESSAGEEAFRAGVRRYMSDYAYGNTVTDDLWKELDKGATNPITQMAHQLTLQAGVPLITEEASSCKDGKTTLLLSQGHYAIDAGSTKARVWQVPVAAAALGGAKALALVSGSKPVTLTVEGCGPVIINAGQGAYFRTRYAPAALAAITAQYGSLSPDDQLGVLNDVASLAYTGQEPMAAFLELVGKVPLDANPLVISAAAGWLEGLDDLYAGLPAQAQFRAHGRAVLNPVFDKLGWDKKDGESDNTQLMRAEIIQALGKFDDAAVLAEARKRFAAYVADPASLNAATRRTVLRVVALHADQAAWDQLHALAKSAKTQIEVQELYLLLASASDPRLARQALELAVSGEPPVTSPPGMIREAGVLHPDLALDFAVAHWTWLAKLIEPSSQASYLPRVVAAGSDVKLNLKLDAFAKDHIEPTGRRELQKTEAVIRYLAKVKQERLPEVDRWLTSHGS
ncbi:MAG TPA: M1 family metallopeptidase [Myxococcales bacterium]|nr:M1 family metallopeptidase [Myxococcales bacterium]